MSKIKFRILIFLICINYISSLIVFPFKISENNDKTFNLRNDLYTTTYLGDSKQLTDLFFNSEEHLYFIDSNNEICIGKNFFNKNFSQYKKSSYIVDLGELEKAYQVNETIYLYKDLKLEKLEKIEDFPFLIKTQTLKEQKGCVSLGILYRTNKEKRKINFLEELKKRKLINTYHWTFKYTNPNEGLFIIGDKPHIYDPDNYNSSNLLSIGSQFDAEAYGWKIGFDKIYSGTSQLPNGISCRISFHNNYILSDEIYNKTIAKQFFNKYMENKICFFYYQSIRHCYYYCDKNKFKTEDMHNFPTLIMTNIELEMNFTFTGEELFYEGKDYYYFKLLFVDNSGAEWIIGQLFLNKYQLIFDNDEKQIMYYNNDRKVNNEPKSNGNGISDKPFIKDRIYIYMLIPLIIIVIAAIIFVLTKYYFCNICCEKKRKKFVNELEDENKEDYFNINSENEEKNDEDKKLYKSNE